MNGYDNTTNNSIHGGTNVSFNNIQTNIVNSCLYADKDGILTSIDNSHNGYLKNTDEFYEFTTISLDDLDFNLNPNIIPITDSDNNLISSTIASTQLNTIATASSDIQIQINNLLSGNTNFTGSVRFENVYCDYINIKTGKLYNNPYDYTGDPYVAFIVKNSVNNLREINVDVAGIDSEGDIFVNKIKINSFGLVENINYLVGLNSSNIINKPNNSLYSDSNGNLFTNSITTLNFSTNEYVLYSDSNKQIKESNILYTDLESSNSQIITNTNNITTNTNNITINTNNITTNISDININRNDITKIKNGNDDFTKISFSDGGYISEQQILAFYDKDLILHSKSGNYNFSNNTASSLIFQLDGNYFSIKQIEKLCYDTNGYNILLHSDYSSSFYNFNNNQNYICYGDVSKKLQSSNSYFDGSNNIICSNDIIVNGDLINNNYSTNAYVLINNSDKILKQSIITKTKLEYLQNLTSDIQTQFDNNISYLNANYGLININRNEIALNEIDIANIKNGNDTITTADINNIHLNNNFLCNNVAPFLMKKYATSTLGWIDNVKPTIANNYNSTGISSIDYPIINFGGNKKLSTNNNYIFIQPLIINNVFHIYYDFDGTGEEFVFYFTFIHKSMCSIGSDTYDTYSR